VGRPTAASRGGRTGGRAGSGGGRTRGRSGDQGDVAELLPTIVAQVGDKGRGQGNGRNQNGDAVNDNIRGDVSTGCAYKEFLACNPKEYDGKGGAIVYTRLIKKMESVQYMSGCRDSQKVKYTAGSFFGKALTWWNSQIRTRGREATVGLAMLRILIGFMSWLGMLRTLSSLDVKWLYYLISQGNVKDHMNIEVEVELLRVIWRRLSLMDTYDDEELGMEIPMDF
nr:reverse transcriptase domain-containing protein [Tanacetum cinerariifolium]